MSSHLSPAAESHVAPIVAIPPIPDWTVSGVLPPFVGDVTLAAANMAPFPATLVQLVARFATSPERIAILNGLLNFRASVASMGIIHGFQWLDGSFLENIENLETRPPKDIDVVTVFRRPGQVVGDAAWQIFFMTNASKFSPKNNKDLFKCDSRWIDLDTPAESVVEMTKYWYGLFSHRRDGIWKGMLRIPLAISSDDAQARALLASPPATAGGASP